jgi:hypothetical protein
MLTPQSRMSLGLPLLCSSVVFCHPWLLDFLATFSNRLKKVAILRHGTPNPVSYGTEPSFLLVWLS